MDELSRLAAFEDCRTLIARFWNSIDDRDFDTMIAQFAPGGVWIRRGVELAAPDEVLRSMTVERSATLVTRHVVSNLDLRLAGDDAIDATSVVTVYRHDGGTLPDGPAPLAPPAAVIVVDDRLVRTAEGWGIARKSSRFIFTADAH